MTSHQDSQYEACVAFARIDDRKRIAQPSGELPTTSPQTVMAPGTPPRLHRRGAPLPWIAEGELSRHKDRYDAWIAVHGTVYDITPHIRHHPGWKNGGVSTVLAIMNVLGRECQCQFFLALFSQLVAGILSKSCQKLNYSFHV